MAETAQQTADKIKQDRTALTAQLSRLREIDKETSRLIAQRAYMAASEDLLDMMRRHVDASMGQVPMHRLIEFCQSAERRAVTFAREMLRG